MLKTLILPLSFCLCLCGPLTASDSPLQDPRVRKVHQKILTIDTHCDTPMLISDTWDPGQRHDLVGFRSSKQDFVRMKEGMLDASFFGVFVGQGALTDEGRSRAYTNAVSIMDRIDHALQKNSALAELALKPDDAYRIKKSGKRAIFLGMENGYPLGLDLKKIDYFYQRGIRYITLCHSSDNDICDSSTDREKPEDRGLSQFGVQVVQRMNQLGIMVDVSHLSEKSFFDVLRTSKAPIIASHSSVRALSDHPRNLTDAQLQALKRNGGVIQICILSEYIKKGIPNPDRDKALQDFRLRVRNQYGSMGSIKEPAVRDQVMQEYEDIQRKFPQEMANVKDAVNHIDYVVRLIGIDHVGIGTDFDGGGELADCRDVTELPRFTQELLHRGYSARDIEKIWGGNAMRVFREVIKKSGSSK